MPVKAVIANAAATRIQILASNLPEDFLDDMVLELLDIPYNIFR